MPSRESSWLRESEPTHSDEIEVILRALTAANLVVMGQRPPDPHWNLTKELLDEAFKACNCIMECRRRTLFTR